MQKSGASSKNSKKQNARRSTHVESTPKSSHNSSEYVGGEEKSKIKRRHTVNATKSAEDRRRRKEFGKDSVDEKIQIRDEYEYWPQHLYL